MFFSSLSNSRRVLILGPEEGLLETRTLLLQIAGFIADVATTADEFKEYITQSQIPYDLFILSHTVSTEEHQTIGGISVKANIEIYRLSCSVPPEDFLRHVSELTV